MIPPHHPTLIPLHPSPPGAGRGRLWLAAIAGPALVLLLVACGGNPPPQPPEPPEPPLPPYTEACQALLDEGLPWCDTAEMECGACVHNPSSDSRHCELAPECPEPPPEPPPCKPQPQARVDWMRGHEGEVADATPARCGCRNCLDWHDDDGAFCYLPPTGLRYCCPLGCEGDPERYPREVDYMGGPGPIWRARGGIAVWSPDGWKGKVSGSCSSSPCGISWCYPNGRACSRWLEVN